MAFGAGLSGCGCCHDVTDGGISMHGLILGDTGLGLVRAQTSIDSGIAAVVPSTAQADPAAPPLPAADTVGGGIGSAGTITVGGSVLVNIETLGDHDWYQVTLTAGTTYTFQTYSDGSGTDAYLYLRDAAGVLLTENDDDGDNTNSLFSYTATTTGTYYIDAGTWNNNTIGGFNLAIATAAPAGDFVGDTTGTAAALTVGGSLNGTVDTSGDHDFYAISLVAGQTYIFRTAGTTATTATDTVLTLRDGAGTQLLTNNDAGEADFSAVRYTAATTGTYYLDVGAVGSGTGAFNVTAFTAPTPTVYTNDQIAFQLTNGYWGGTSHRYNVSAGGSLSFNVQLLTVDGQNLARQALALWSDVTGIVFNEVATGGQLRFDDNQTGAFAQANRTGGFITSSDINVGTAWITTYGTGLNTYSFQTYVHEIGHAIGLGHGGNYNGSADYNSDSLYLNDSWATTIMSYFDQTENTYFQAQGFTRQFALTPMVGDGIAVSNLYGTATTTRTGDTTYGFNNTSGRDIYNAALFATLSYTVYDNGGIDTLDYSGFGQNQRIDLNAESFSNVGARVGNVSIARGSVIENAIGGSGGDVLIGNAADNRLTGNAGADSLTGGNGNDTLFADMLDTVLSGGAGTDKVVFSTSGVVAATLSGLEALELVGGVAVTIAAAAFKAGFATNSVLSGTGGLTLTMLAADPSLLIQQLQAAIGSALTITINGSTAVNIVKAAVGISTVYNGGTATDQVRGSNLADTIVGGDGNDKIYAAGGGDTLTGGNGSDQFRYLFASDSGLGASGDVITDFTLGGDKLDFRLFDADTVAAGRQAVAFVGTAAFVVNGTAQARYGDSGPNLLVEIDVNGDGIADMHIFLTGLVGQTLTGGDFLL